MTQSTFLIGNCTIKDYIVPKRLTGKRLTSYLSHLLNDRELQSKLRRLKKPGIKKRYQKTNQNLKPIYFYPKDNDWIFLSYLSHSTGYSRCFLFVYLMLIDMGVLKIKGKERNKRLYIKNLLSETLSIQIHYSIFKKEKKAILIL